VAKTIAELDREVAGTVSTMTERLTATGKGLDQVQTSLEKTIEIVHDGRREFKVLKHRFEDYVKRMEIWDNRRWGLIMLMAGALLSLAAGLIVALVRR